MNNIINGMESEYEMPMKYENNIVTSGYVKVLEEDTYYTKEYVAMLLTENIELKDKTRLLNEMNEKNYNNYCEELKKNKQLEEIISRLEENRDKAIKHIK